MLEIFFLIDSILPNFQFHCKDAPLTHIVGYFGQQQKKSASDPVVPVGDAKKDLFVCHRLIGKKVFLLLGKFDYQSEIEGKNAVVIVHY